MTEKDVLFIRAYKQRLITALRLAMIEQGVTQNDIAETLGVTPQYISAVLKSNTPTVSRALLRMARALSVDPGSLGFVNKN